MLSLSFLRAWAADPLQVGAIAPSSGALAAAITARLTPESAPVVELGAGTGVLTRSIIDRGIPEDQLALVECNGDFARKLEHQFPKARVVMKDARELSRGDILGGERAGAVVSGIPLLLLPRSKVLAILEAAFGCLRPDGALYQFTYGFRAPVDRITLDRLGLQSRRIGGTLVNLPPAAVYEIKRRISRTAIVHPAWSAMELETGRGALRTQGSSDSLARHG